VAYDSSDEEIDSPEFLEQRRTAFGGFAATYDAVRPEWPAETISWLIDGRRSGSRVLDLGAGTGKGTRTLVAMGMRATAVDPSEGMLAALQAAVSEATVLVGDAESIPLADNSVDAVIVLRAWHWFDPARAAAECARVLTPGGSLGIAWHVRDERVPWVADLSDAAGRREDPAADLRGVDVPEVGGWFGPMESTVLGYELVLSVDRLVELASSWSYVALAEDRDDRLAAVRRVGAAAAVDGVVRIPHRTQCFRFRVTPA
jgi:ubiquinone/menaquinone biosynthesis C-methylase UbiE